jgi:esterase FrsA
VNDLKELKEYVQLHARGQRLKGYQELLDRISSDDDHNAPGSWVREWCVAADSLAARGLDLQAAKHYAMAAFPFVNGPARADAHQRCVQALGRWQEGQRGMERLEVNLDGGVVRGWADGLGPVGGSGPAQRRPLLLVMGGIVTLKEQWAPVLPVIQRLGMAGIVTEMPGVGENTMRYEPGSWRMLSGLLDAVADRADVSQTYAIALSFSGHMALRCALEDRRIRGVVTVGAPISAFFTDLDWQRRLPAITTAALANMIGIAPEDVAGRLGERAITREQLSGLDIPVGYVASSRDEIIPAAETLLLRDHVGKLDFIEFDDVHGSPRHVRETQLWTMGSLLRARGVRNAQSMALSLLLRMERARRVLVPA